MRVGIDARLVGRGLGIATYVSGLAAALARRADVEVVWIGDRGHAPPGVSGEPAAARHWPYPALDSAPGRRLARRLGLDVMHFTGNTGWRAPGAVPAVLTVHDLIFLAGGRGARQRLGRAYGAWSIGRAVSAASGLVTVSETSGAALQARFGRRADVIPHGVPYDPALAPRERDPGGGLVCFAGRDPRKGLDLALAVLRAAGPSAGPLRVIARAGLPAGFADDARAELGDGRVRVHRGADDDTVRAWLSEATALLYLSRDEGFGLPVLEAMALGVPAITGMAPATREVARSAGLLVDRDDPVRSAVAHLRALADPAVHARVSRRGLEVARAHSWDHAAERHVAVYQRAAR